MEVIEPDGSLQPAVFETHISTVVFAGDRAFKFMKPIATAFLDQSTVEKRRKACEAELLLNRRIAPDVYLGIGQVIEDDVVTDHFLVMRRLPITRRLSALVESDEFPDAVRDVARAVAAFHAGQPVTTLATEMASSAGVGGLWASNIDEMQGFDDATVDKPELDRIAVLARRFLDGRGPLFTTRVRNGFARDGHGDLLADDIFMLDDGPRVLDCLAFDERLRCGDVLLDVAFLAMDIERLGAPAMAEHLVQCYCAFSNEHHPRSLAHFYIAYRALVRAKVNFLRAAQGDATAAAAARRFLRQCERHLAVAVPMLVLVGGSPGTGKTTLANDLADALGLLMLSSDEVRKDLVGIAHDQHAFAPPGQGIYTPAISARTYEELIRHGQGVLALGESVVLDASWARADDRRSARRMGDEIGAYVIELRCDAAPEIAAQRITARLQTSDPSDATPEIAAHVRAHLEEWPESVPIDTNRRRDASLGDAIAACVRARGLDG
jgi:aminoglycoside phosphotransferase family enzyme/predicted kinase